jgi:hypothetical protein
MGLGFSTESGASVYPIIPGGRESAASLVWRFFLCLTGDCKAGAEDYLERGDSSPLWFFDAKHRNEARTVLWFFGPKKRKKAAMNRRTPNSKGQPAIFGC